MIKPRHYKLMDLTFDEIHNIIIKRFPQYYLMMGLSFENGEAFITIRIAPKQPKVI